MIGRESEIKILNDAYESDESKFIAIYGRRRIGKTYLVNNVFSGEFAFSHSGANTLSKREQLMYFAQSLKKFGLNDFEAPTSWLDAFSLLENLLEKSDKKRKVVFLDELSWIDTPCSGFLSAFEYFWNSWACARKDILLIISASASSWIIDKVVNNTGGLYKRLNRHIKLEPFTLLECKKYLESLNFSYTNEMISELYMIFGGVPYYWSLLDRDLSSSQNIDKLFFKENAELKDELNCLYKSIFKFADDYLKIIEALSTKKNGMTREEIINKTKLLNNGQITKKINDLELCGFIKKYKKMGNRSKESIYQLIDNFTLFYYKFLKDQDKEENFWSYNINNPKINTWNGFSFELICLQHINAIKQKLGIGGVYTEVYSWQCKENIEQGYFGSQIDLLIVRKDKVINLCEIKYSKDKFVITKDIDDKLRHKINDLSLHTKRRYAIHLTMITSHGLSKNMYSGNVVKEIEMEDLFI